MEPEFYITHDEKELIIECLESYIKEKTPHENDDPMYVADTECTIDHLRYLIERIRRDL